MRSSPVAADVRHEKFTNRSVSSYDGDEQNTKQAPQPQPAPLPDRVEEPIAAEPGPPQKDVKFEDLIKVEPETLNQDQHIYSNGQNGTSVWADSQGNEAHENNYGDGAVEEESRGIGIKEDG